MKRRVLIAATIGFFVSACASGPPPPPPAPPPLDPTGTYDFTVNAQGMEIGGVLVISGSAEAGYTGNISTEMGGGAISNVTVDGQTMTFSLPEFGVAFEVVFEGDEFSGFLTGNMGDADIVGANCGLGMVDMTAIVRGIKEHTDLPVWAKANAGLPELVDGETVFKETPAQMAAVLPALLAEGPSVVGGCCGTTPEHIKIIAERCSGRA